MDEDRLTDPTASATTRDATPAETLWLIRRQPGTEMFAIFEIPDDEDAYDTPVPEGCRTFATLDEAEQWTRTDEARTIAPGADWAHVHSDCSSDPLAGADLVDRLRHGTGRTCLCHAWYRGECACEAVWAEDYIDEAADEIERLRAENAALHEAWRQAMWHDTLIPIAEALGVATVDEHGENRRQFQMVEAIIEKARRA